MREYSDEVIIIRTRLLIDIQNKIAAEAAVEYYFKEYQILQLKELTNLKTIILEILLMN